MKYALCNELYENVSVEDSIARIAKAGYQGVEIAPFTIAENARDVSAERKKSIRLAAKNAGVEIIGLHWLLAKPPGFHINGPDAALRQKTKEYFEVLIDLCAELGGKVLVYGSPKSRTVLPNDHWSEVWKRSVEVFGPLSERAGKNGCVIALEPLGPKDNCNFINTMVEGSLLCKAVNHPAFKLHLDVKAMHAEGRPVAETIRLEGNNLMAHFHANDPNLRGPGMGEMAFEPIAQALKDVKYDGWVSVEVFDFTPGADATAEISLRTLKRAFAAAQ